LPPWGWGQGRIVDLDGRIVGLESGIAALLVFRANVPWGRITALGGGKRRWNQELIITSEGLNRRNALLVQSNKVTNNMIILTLHLYVIF